MSRAAFRRRPARGAARHIGDNAAETRDLPSRAADPSPASVKDHYRTLGIDPTAGEAEVRAAYRKLAFALHPDRNPSPEAHAAFQAVQEAYELLSDAARRRDYDENRRRSLIDDPLDVAREMWSAYLKGALK